MECRDWAIATSPPASQAPARELPTSKPEEISPFPAAGSSLKIVWFARAPWFALYGRRLEWFSEIVIPTIIRGETMFTPQTLGIALAMMITSAICWGSWANTYKGVKNYRFELFYWDYALGIFLVSLFLGLTLGSAGHDASSLINNIHSADTSNIAYALVGGALFNLANLLLVAAIDMAGLAVAFPVSIGIALVVGTVLSYALQPKGNAAFLALGVVCALIAVILDGKAYGSLAETGRSVSKKSIVTCVVSGVLMGLWAPFMTHAMTRGSALGPYSAAL